MKFKTIFTENEIEECSEFAREGSTRESTTPRKSVSSRLFDEFDTAGQNCKIECSIPWKSVGQTGLNHPWWWALRSPTNIKDDFLSNS